MKYVFIFAMAMGLAALAAPASARVLIEQSGETGPTPESRVREFAFGVDPNEQRLAFAVTVQSSAGIVRVKLVDADGRELQNVAGQTFMIGPVMVDISSAKRALHIEVTTSQQVGHWQ